ncbi:uncharacterized protein (DUF58 family) [Haloferula luteola]|uniref:Uncharacterized protein (DUF58 family) n=1 Tax=Haloferula luteola TaxID=595692 RepID=A0A840UYR5_9BACT|nr:DUF58 domain-containing protein [Haloferula luteola]MBB5351277.1 uncharacterized protein (DUF58 family) [Haloferula luteola]
MAKSKKEQREEADNEARAAEIMARVRRVDIRTSRLVDDHLSGSYASVFKGRGMDFDRVRNYVPGDDVRVIDWNVTARTGEPFIKMFTEERELTILLMVDVSASSDFGSSETSKREMQTEIAGVLASSAIRNRDKVGLVLFSDEVELYSPPVKGRTNILRVIREALFFQPTGRGTNLCGALDFVNQVLRRRAVVFLVSDFRLTGSQSSGDLRRKLAVTGRHHDVIAMSVNDPREDELPNVGVLRIEDAETGEDVELDTGKASVREAYRQQAARRRQEMKAAIAGSGVDHLEFTSGEEWLPQLMGFFRKRRHQS